MLNVLDEITEIRIKELEGLIAQARNDYYNDLPSVTDEVYDAWVDELSELKVDSPMVQAIGATPVSEWKKVAHDIPMGSLDKVNTLEEFTSWFGALGVGSSESLLVTEKLDGISIHVKYEKGVFSQAITRGDGAIGEDISSNVVRMQGIPATIEGNFTGSLRGEIVLTRSAHKNYFPDYANPRNAASGIAKRYDGKGCEYLTVKFYRVADGMDFDSEADQFEWLESKGLQVPNWYVTAVIPGVKTPHDIWVEYQQSKRSELDYDIDGLVVSLNNLTKQLALGEKNNRPKGAIAFKFAAITRETVIRNIVWQVGGTGHITPVAEFDPIPLMGAIVTRASLYNYKYIRTLGIDVGSKVIVARANDVIPRVAAVSRSTGTIADHPTVCPVCGAPTERQGEFLVCLNIAGCSAQLVGRIKRYIKSLDIKEWGDVLIEKLVSAELVTDVSDLYRLTAETLANIDRMGDKSAQNVLDSLHAKNPIPLENLLGALSIPLCASTTIRMVMDAGFETWEQIQGATRQELENVPGLGPIKAQSLYDWIHKSDEIGQYLMRTLGEVGVKIQPTAKGVLTGMSFCFTGTMKNKRPALEKMVKDAGGTVKASVTKGLNYLVMADPTSGSSKAQAARKNGTKCIAEEDFLRMVKVI